MVREGRPTVSVRPIAPATVTNADRGKGSSAAPAVVVPAIGKAVRLVRPKAREAPNNRSVVADLGRAGGLVRGLVRKEWGRKAQWVAAARWGLAREAPGVSRKEWVAAIPRCTG